MDIATDSMFLNVAVIYRLRYGKIGYSAACIDLLYAWYVKFIGT